MKRNFIFPLVLFVAAAWLSAWLTPAFGQTAPGMTVSADERMMPAGLNGRTLLQTGDRLAVEVASAPDAHDIRWLLDGRAVGEDSALRLAPLRDGEYTLSLTYRDDAGRLHGASTLVRVLAPEPYALQAAAIHAAITLPLWVEDDETFLPFIRR